MKIAYVAMTPEQLEVEIEKCNRRIKAEKERMKLIQLIANGKKYEEQNKQNTTIS